MSNRSNYHVVPDGGKWVGKKTGEETTVAEGDNKAEVVAATIEEAKNNEPSSVRIHKGDGTFEEERTYGDDPARYPG